MKLKVLFSLMLISLSSTVFAKLPPRPSTCPSLSAIKSLPFSTVLSTKYGYLTAVASKYNTPSNWVFIMGYFKTYNAIDAMITANQNLTKVTGNPVSEPTNDQTEWMCIYSVPGTSFGALAVTQSTYNARINTQQISFRK